MTVQQALTRNVAKVDKVCIYYNKRLIAYTVCEELKNAEVESTRLRKYTSDKGTVNTALAINLK